MFHQQFFAGESELVLLCQFHLSIKIFETERRRAEHDDQAHRSFYLCANEEIFARMTVVTFVLSVEIGDRLRDAVPLNRHLNVELREQLEQLLSLLQNRFRELFIERMNVV